MPYYKVSQAAKLMGVSSDTMRRWVDAGRLRATSDPTGHLSIEGTELARLARELAGDEDKTRGAGQSTRNHISGIVTGVKRDEVVALVELQAGPYRLVSLITREAADELGLEPGMMADAVVKATNVSIDVAPPN